MRLAFEKTKDSPLNILRRAGYSFLRRDDATGEMSFAKRVGNEDYPRFHVYVKTNKSGDAEINLHLDQKKASYQGSVAHSGEYEAGDNKWIEREADEIRKSFKNS